MNSGARPAHPAHLFLFIKDHTLSRLLHPEINQTSRLFSSLHRRFAIIRTTRQCFDQAIDGEPRFSECESRQIKRQLHQSNVEEIVVAVEPLSRFLTQIGPNEDSLRSVQIHFAAEQPKRNRQRVMHNVEGEKREK
ncbi:unnamed protein product, partial [Vitis vinifera]